MNQSLRRWLARLGLSLSVGVGSALAMTSPAWSQEPEAPAPAPAESEEAEEPKEADQAEEDADQPQPGDREEEAERAAEQAKETAEEGREAAQEAAQDTRQEAQRTREQARDAAQRTRDAARDTADRAQDAARDTADRARDAARDTADQARDAARQGAQDARETVRGFRPEVQAGVDAAAQFRAEDYRPADLGLWFARGAEQGLVISDVATTGAIAELGFMEGDRIVSVNGQRVLREADFVNYLFAPEVRDERAQVVVLRDGREEVIHVHPAVLIQELTAVHHDPLEEFGIVLDDRYEDRLLVWKVIRRSPAYYAGIRPGDVIVSINNQRVATPAQLTQMVTELGPGPVTVEVMRREQVRRIEVDAPRLEVREVDSRLPQDRPDVRIEGEAVAPPVRVAPPAVVPAPDSPRIVNPPPARRPLLPRRRQP